MENLEEFNIETLHALVDQALQVPEKFEEISNSSPLSFSLGDTSLFELFYDALLGVCNVEETQAVIDVVRSKYAVVSTKTDLKTLYTFVKNCRKCDSVDPNPITSLGNLVNPDVVFLYDRPMFSTESFRNWTSLLKEAGFLLERVAHVSVVKCMPADKNQLDTSVISQCSKSYLFTELQLLSPELVVLCGSMPTKLFLGDIDTLNSHKGIVHWLGPWAFMPVHTMFYSEKSGPNAVKGLQADIQKAYNFCYA